MTKQLFTKSGRGFSVSWWPMLLAGAIFLFVIGNAEAGVTTRVSVDSVGNQGNNSSAHPAASADGRFVAFGSYADNLVAEDTNGIFDVFIHDRQAGETTRVSVDSAGNQTNTFSSNHPSVSSDGRFVAFDSWAGNLVAEDTNSKIDIFVRDYQTGQTTRVSVDNAGNQGNNDSSYPSISADGRYVTFQSNANNLVAEDTNEAMDIFVHDRNTGQTTRVSVDSSGNQADHPSYEPAISANGRYVAFQSHADNLVAWDSNGVMDVFVHDRQTGQTTRISVDSSGNQANGPSSHPSVSADGRYVAFDSWADNLVAGDTNGSFDIFVRDCQTGQTTRVSVDSFGNQANHDCYSPSIDAAGRYVAFESEAYNLVPGDTNGQSDIFVHDRNTGQTTRVSVDSTGNQADHPSHEPAISADGHYVAFTSEADNLVAGDTNGVMDIFVHDLYAEDCVFNWAEAMLPAYLAPAGSPSITAGTYYGRIYSQTGAILATESTSRNLYYFGPASGYTILDLGPMTGWYSTSGCGGVP